MKKTQYTQPTLKMTWDKYGHDMPFWAVLTNSNPSESDIGDFMIRGNDDIDEIFSDLHSLGIELRLKNCLDFGSGVGRLSQALANVSQSVTGLDISANMVELARTLHSDLNNVKFEVLTEELFPSLTSDSFDFILSLITLQHIPIELVKTYFKEFARLLEPNGIFVFNMPSDTLLPRMLTKIIRWGRWKWHQRRLGMNVDMMQMNTFKRDELIKYMEELGLELVHVARDNLSPLFVSYRYFFRKR